MVSFPVSLSTDRKHRGAGRSPAIVTASLGRARAHGHAALSTDGVVNKLHHEGHSRARTRFGTSRTRSRLRRERFQEAGDVRHRLTDRLRQHACANAARCLSHLRVAPLGEITRCGVATAASPRRLAREYLRSARPCRSRLHLRAEFGDSQFSSPSRSLSRSTHVRARAPSGRDWPRPTRAAAATKHGRLSIPSPSPFPYGSRRRATRRDDCSSIRETRPLFRRGRNSPRSRRLRSIDGDAYRPRDRRSPARNLLRFNAKITRALARLARVKVRRMQPTVARVRSPVFFYT